MPASFRTAKCLRIRRVFASEFVPVFVLEFVPDFALDFAACFAPELVVGFVAASAAAFVAITARASVTNAQAIATNAAVEDTAAANALAFSSGLS
nr:hypothetical protein [Paenibacillus plantarum]